MSLKQAATLQGPCQSEDTVPHLFIFLEWRTSIVIINVSVMAPMTEPATMPATLPEKKKVYFKPGSPEGYAFRFIDADRKREYMQQISRIRTELGTLQIFKSNHKAAVMAPFDSVSHHIPARSLKLAAFIIHR